MPSTTLTSPPRSDQPLGAALHPIHQAWVQQARRFLEPALAPEADFWTRWAAVRYLADDFREQYRLERALIGELRSFIEAQTARVLLERADRVFTLRLELDRIGRRRGTATEVAATTLQLLEHLVAWFAEIELAAADLARDSLPREAADLLAHLEAARPAGP